MHRMSTTYSCLISIAIVSIFILTLGACSSSKSDLATEVSGKWQTEQGNGTVDINLAKNATSLTIDGRTFKGDVEKIDAGTNTVHLKVETDTGNKEEWSIHQVWNDNGSSFKLKLRRNGTTETLVPVKSS